MIMKSILPVAVVATFMCACSPKDAKVASAADAFTIDSAEFIDSVVEGGNASRVTLNVTYPTASGAATDSINRWISDRMDAPAALRTPDMRQLVHTLGLAYMDTVRAALAEEKAMGMVPPAPQEYNFQIGPDYITDKFVTYSSSDYRYLGGAHGGTAFKAAVFALPSGTILGYDMFKPDSLDAVRTLVIDALKSQFFKVTTDAEMAEDLLVAPENVTLPTQAPYFMPDGVCFVYQQYEIAPYSEGMPNCTLSYRALQPYFSPKAESLLSK